VIFTDLLASTYPFCMNEQTEKKKIV